MSELSISNVIRVTVQGVQRSRTPKNVNEVALFTPEQPNNVLESMYVIDPSDVASAYGSNSLTYKMALAVFSQSPNLLSGNGGLVVIPMKNATNATAASFTSSAITVSNFAAVNNGSLKVTENSNVINLSGLDFSQVATINDIASIFKNALPQVDISVSDGKIVFGSKKLGASSSITLAAGTGGTSLDATGLLGVEGGTSVAGVDGTGETLGEAITRTYGSVAYTGVMCAKYMDDAEVSAAAAIVSAKDLIFVNAWYSASDILGACQTLQAASNTKVRCLVYTMGFEAAKLMMAAYVGRAFSVNFEGSNVSQTMNLKTLSGISPDAGISQTDYNNAENAGVDLYVSYEGDPAVKSNGANEYFDVVYENMALKFYAQVALYNALKTSGTKLPQTEAGVNVLKNALGNAFKQFVRNGVIAAGEWNSAQTFGDPETFRNNIRNQGWYVYSIPVAQQSQAQREARIAPYIQGACKRAGAIHEADVLIFVEE